MSKQKEENSKKLKTGLHFLSTQVSGDASTMKGKKLTRKMMIQTLVDALEPLAYVHSFWEGGAAAFDRIDEWSDIDLYLVVDNNKVDETFIAVEKALESLSPIKRKYDITHPPKSGLSQVFYRLEGVSEYLLIDLAVLTLSSPDKFLEPEIHGDVIFYFNKSDKVKPSLLDRDVLVKKLQERLERLQARFDIFNSFIKKEINRGNYLEAIDLYHSLTLASLVEVLRIKHYPVHHNFKMRYIHYELPHEIITKLELLYFVKDEKDLQEKYLEAAKWFRNVMSEIDQEEIKRLIRIS